MSRAYLAEAKFVTKSLTPKSFSNAIHFASLSTAEEKMTDFEYKLLDNVELAIRQCWPHHLAYSPDHIILKLAVHFRHIDYAKYQLAQGDTNVDVGYMLIHGMMCSLANARAISIDTGLDLDFIDEPRNRDSTLEYCRAITSRGTSWPNIDLGPEPELVEAILFENVDPNLIWNGTCPWRWFLENMSEQLDGPNSAKALKIFRVFVSRGANISEQSDAWSAILTRDHGVSLKNLSTTISIFKLLFTHGLNPNTRSENVCLWVSCTQIVCGMLGSDTFAERSNELLLEFLRHGADITELAKDIYGMGWINRAIYALQTGEHIHRLIHYHSQLEIFFQHGLDPNSNCTDGKTIWENILHLIQVGLRIWNTKRPCCRVVHQKILLVLRYGADPRCTILHDILLYIGNSPSGFQLPEMVEIRKVLRQELKHLEARERDLHELRPTPEYLRGVVGTQSNMADRTDYLVANQ